MAIITARPIVRKSPDTSGSRGIIRALGRYHDDRDEIWMAEAEIGRRGLRVDMFTVKPSWHPLPTIYEVKISRADYKRDEKWRLYLPYCQRFYYAAPKGLLDPSEIDKEAGLVTVAPDGTVAIEKGARNRVIPAKNMSLMMHRLLFRYAYAGGNLRQPNEIPIHGPKSGEGA